MSQDDARSGLSPEMGAKLEAYRLGTMDPEEQEIFERELLARPELARALYESEGLDAALRVGMDSPRRVRRIPRRLLIPLAAAALIVVAILPRFSTQDATGPVPNFRGSESELSTLAPSGDAYGEQIDFSWTSYEGALRYRMEVFDWNSRMILERKVEATQTVVAALELFAVANRPGFWRVTALGELDEELATSAPAPLQVH